MIRILLTCVLICCASKAFSELSVADQKKKLMDQIVAAEDPAIRERLQEVYESVGLEKNEVYIECILENMKGVANDFAAKAVESACRLRQQSLSVPDQQERASRIEVEVAPVSSKERQPTVTSPNTVIAKGGFGLTGEAGRDTGYELTNEDKLYLSKLDEKITAQEKVWRKAGRLIEDKGILDYVNAVLAQVTPETKSADFINFRVSIFDSYDFHRSHTANGQIFLSTGLLVSLAGKADLARVLAHQVAGIQLYHDLSVKDANKQLRDIVKLRPDYLFERDSGSLALGAAAGAVGGGLVSGVFAVAADRREQGLWRIRKEKELDARKLAAAYFMDAGFQNYTPVIAYDFKTGLPDVKGSTVDSRVHAIFPDGLLPTSVAQQAAVRTAYDPQYQELIWDLTEKTISWAAVSKFPKYLLAIAEGSEKQLQADAGLSILIADAYLEGADPEMLRRAESWLLNSAKLTPDSPIILHRMGEVYYRQNFLQKAARAFIQYLKTGDTSADREAILIKLRVIKGKLASVESKDG